MLFEGLQVPRVPCRRGPRAVRRLARRGRPGAVRFAPWARARGQAGEAAGRAGAGAGGAAWAAERSPRCSSQLRSRWWPAEGCRSSSAGVTFVILHGFHCARGGAKRRHRDKVGNKAREPGASSGSPEPDRAREFLRQPSTLVSESGVPGPDCILLTKPSLHLSPIPAVWPRQSPGRSPLFGLDSPKKGAFWPLYR